MNGRIGTLRKDIIKLLDLPYRYEQPIYISNANIEHMKRKHFQDYLKYGTEIKEIIKNPTYIAKNPKQNSIEYIKEYKLDNNTLVLVAVRASHQGKLFVRTMFTMSEKKKDIYLRKGYAKKMLVEYLKKIKCML